MPVAFSVAYICCALYALKLDTLGAAKCLKSGIKALIVVLLIIIFVLILLIFIRI